MTAQLNNSVRISSIVVFSGLGCSSVLFALTFASPWFLGYVVKTSPVACNLLFSLVAFGVPVLSFAASIALARSCNTLRPGVALAIRMASCSLLLVWVGKFLSERNAPAQLAQCRGLARQIAGAVLLYARHHETLPPSLEYLSKAHYVHRRALDDPLGGTGDEAPGFTLLAASTADYSPQYASMRPLVIQIKPTRDGYVAVAYADLTSSTVHYYDLPRELREIIGAKKDGDVRR